MLPMSGEIAVVRNVTYFYLVAVHTMRSKKSVLEMSPGPIAMNLNQKSIEHTRIVGVSKIP